MKLTATQKKELIELFKSVDVKKLDVEIGDSASVKWFRFGSYNGLQIAIEIINAIGTTPKTRNKTPAKQL